MDFQAAQMERRRLADILLIMTAGVASHRSVVMSHHANQRQPENGIPSIFRLPLALHTRRDYFCVAWMAVSAMV